MRINMVIKKVNLDIEELDAEITDGLELVYVKDMSEVLNNALVL